MKKQLYLLFIFISLTSFGQESTNDLQNIIRANVLSPGLEMEVPLSNNSIFATNVGIGIQGSYNDLSYTGSGFIYFIAPFLDMSYKKFYNRDKRFTNGKNISSNSGNYWGARLLTNFKEMKAHNLNRKDDIDFAVGPTWGIQRAYGSFHYLFDVGPVYYFDSKGNSGFFPIMLQLNIGFDLKKW